MDRTQKRCKTCHKTFESAFAWQPQERWIEREHCTILCHAIALKQSLAQAPARLGKLIEKLVQKLASKSLPESEAKLLNEKLEAAKRGLAKHLSTRKLPTYDADVTYDSEAAVYPLE